MSKEYQQRILTLLTPGLIIALSTMSFSFVIEPPDNAAVAVTGLTLYLASYAVGLGPVAWLLPSEVFATSIRAKGVSLATFLNRGMATVMVCTFLTVKNTISWPVFFLILAFIVTITMIVLYFYLPETKGRSLEDMSLYFSEETGDFSLLDAERKLRVESKLKKMKDGKAAAPEFDVTSISEETNVTASPSEL